MTKRAVGVLCYLAGMVTWMGVSAYMIWQQTRGLRG